jgi:hypothetical protein
VWDLQLRSNDTIHFPNLRTEKVENHAEGIKILKQEFSSRFEDVRKNVATVNLFSVPFNGNIETVPAEFQMNSTPCLL